MIPSIKIFFRIFRPKFYHFFFKFVNKNEKKPLLLSSCLHIFWPLFEKSKDVYWSFFVDFFRNIMKIFRKSSLKFLLLVFWIIYENLDRITCEMFWYLFGFLILTDGRVKRISILNYWWNYIFISNIVRVYFDVSA
jgi:hypothetical protein